MEGALPGNAPSPPPGSAERIRKLDELTTELKGVQLVTDDALFSAEEAS
jgi:hypothetical protein